MTPDLIASGHWLPFVFAALLGLSMLVYAVLDGYDLGVGMLSGRVQGADRDRMIAAIGPFWDANETWLILGAGLLLVAFPAAHGIVLGQLYLPIAIMLIALIFRGVAFDFRKKAPPPQQAWWDRAFQWGSLVTALAQGWMLGRFIMGFAEDWAAWVFAAGFALVAVCGYLLMGATWLLIKTDGELQQRAIRWTRQALWSLVAAALATTLWAIASDPRIAERLLRFPEVALLVALPLTGLSFAAIVHLLCGILPLPGDRLSWLPFAISVLIVASGFAGLIYSFYPDIIPGRMTIVEAAAAPSSLWIILVGTLFVLPFLIGYTAYAYWVFRGKARDLSYE
ncbi:MAG: cytochrome d ubiquinol oxidase subunit II [Planctomycetota bacterium]|nr:cytochrome d ubiquinol oxidase subunit II [Planctomycetota bacterium]MCX8040772.1 cytochrome d ubiquinol oxidase subunit II [Planctomycetota bacterium]MDW8372150.1 cytochrome d ubiquinol oxidase subunit II [Planctomycetota bacterium]